MEQGFAPSQIIPKAESALGRAAGGATKAEITNKAASIATQGARIEKSVEQKQIERMQGIKSTLMLPTQLEFFGFLGGGALSWVTRKLNWNRATVVVRALLNAPGEALRNTQIKDILRLPANFMTAVGKHATEAGGKATGWAKAADVHAVGLNDVAANAEKIVAEKTLGVLGTVERSLERADATSVGKNIHGALDGVRKSRIAAAEMKQAKAVSNVAQVAQREATGLFRSMLNFVTRTKPAAVEAGIFEPIMRGVQEAHGIENVAEKAAHLKAVGENLEKLMKDTKLTGEVAKRANNVAKHVRKAVNSAQAVELFHGAGGGGLKSMVSGFAQAASRIPLFHALVGAGVVAGVGLTLLSARAESKQAKAAQKELMSDLGEASNSAFAKAVNAAHKKQANWSVVKTGLELGGGAVGDAIWIMPGGGGMGMMGAMMLPQLCSSLVPDNPMLAAYMALKQGDKGQVQLTSDQRVELTKQLVAALPSVAQHGGRYNRLAGATAKEMVARNMSAQAIVQLLGDDKAFTSLAADVKEKQAAAAGAANDKSYAPAAANEPKIATAEKTYQGAAKPGKITDQIEHLGTVAQLQRQKMA